MSWRLTSPEFLLHSQHCRETTFLSSFTISQTPMFPVHPTWEVRRARSTSLIALVDGPRHGAHKQGKGGTEQGTRSPRQPQTAYGLGEPVPFLRGIQRSTVSPTMSQLSSLQSKKPQDPSPLLASMGPIVQEAIWLDPSSLSSRTASLERGLPCALLSRGWLPWGSLWGRGPSECDLLSSGWI